jgi:hypothetical protein
MIRRRSNMITGAITARLSVAVIYLATERVSLQRLNRMLGRENVRLKEARVEQEKKLKSYYENSARFVTEEPSRYYIAANVDGVYDVCLAHKWLGSCALIKRFDSDDEEYNRALAEELREKLEEKI